MSKRDQIIQDLEKEKLICIFRAKYKDINVIIDAASACIATGAHFIEITYDHTGYANNSFQIVKALKDKYKDKAYIGFGTVLNLDEAKKCLKYTDDYIVAPTFSKEISDYCKENDIYYMPGVLTATEAVNAYQEGNPIVKLFPTGEIGLDYAKALMKPLGFIKYFGVGKMTTEFYEECLKFGFVGCGVSSSINSLEILDAKDYTYIQNKVSEYIAISKQF